MCDAFAVLLVALTVILVASVGACASETICPQGANGSPCQLTTDVGPQPQTPFYQDIVTRPDNASVADVVDGGESDSFSQEETQQIDASGASADDAELPADGAGSDTAMEPEQAAPDADTSSNDETTESDTTQSDRFRWRSRLLWSAGLRPADGEATVQAPYLV